MINAAKLITSLMNDNPTSIGQRVELRAGQILKGTVLKLLSETQALVQLGGLKVTAELNANLNAGDKVWLQVQPSNDPVTLKILDQNQWAQGAKPIPQNLPSLASSLGLPDSEAAIHVLTRFIKEQIPIEAKLMEQAVNWIEQTGTGPEGMEPLLIAVNKGLPIRNEILSALKEVLYGPPLIKLGQELKEVMNSLQKSSHISNDLTQQVEEWVTLADSILKEISQDSEITGDKLKEQLKSLGLMWERQLRDSSSPMDEKNLKTVLHILEDKLTKVPEGSTLTPIVEKLITHLTGQQLLMKSSPSLMEQLVIQIPFSFLGDKLPFVQLEGKKRAKGGLDPDHCRLLFYLHLNTLGEMFVNVTVTNRIVSVQIVGKHPELEERAKSFHKQLQDGLKKEGYHLSLFKIGEIKRESGNRNISANLFAKQRGMDIRI
jgi:hypothetical protein